MKDDTPHKKPNTARPGGSQVIQPEKKTPKKSAPEQGEQPEKEVTENAD